MVIQCKNLISLYILPDQRRVNLLVLLKLKYFLISTAKVASLTCGFPDVLLLARIFVALNKTKLYYLLLWW